MAGKVEEGTIFAGRYRVVRCLATGGMGAVYEVIHLETARRRALKVMHAHLFQSDEMRGRFKREARIAAQVDSEHIVDVLDAGVDEATGTPFLVMELLHGEELGERLKRLGRLPPEEVVTYLQQTAWALDRTHAESIVHRDLKPENLFLTTREDGSPRIKILDFGVAKLIAEGTAGATQSLGTPLYMAPEQIRATTSLTAAADIHALTLMTYTLLVGEAYWAEEARTLGDLLAFAIVVVQGPREPAVQRAARHGVRLPPDFDGWFAKGTAGDPAERYSTATEAVRALRAAGIGPGAVIPTITAPPAQASEGGTVLLTSPLAPSGAGVLARAVTSTGASELPSAPRRTSHVSLAATAATLALGVLSTGTWLSLRPGNAGPATSNQPVITAVSPAPAEVVAPVEAAPSVSASARAVSISISSARAVAPSARPAVVVKPAPPPAASVKRPPPGDTLLGRD